MLMNSIGYLLVKNAQEIWHILDALAKAKIKSKN